MPNDDLNGKLACVSCGAILLDTPKDAQQFTVIMCADCNTLGSPLSPVQGEAGLSEL